MGPSGAGKDSLLSAVLADPPETAGKIVLAGRLVTRGTTAPSGDVFVTPEDFERLLREKRLALHWESHGHRYGVPRAMDLALLAGALVLVNGSRAHYPRARELYPDLAGVMVTADEEVVRRRLMSRGRENPAGIAERIGRNKSLDSPPPAGVLVVDNSGPLEEAARIFRLFLAEIGGGPPKLTAACPAPSARSGL
ncbi:MAG: phosphonate metabolism protein/1,5-bisphosphokinase (PRPP-forming) PhnN [Deltaproteobacteria bacterium]|jgi:ribose 1,5-bisphosphokinase|nr:phosphonate metabolism protein/1,5-bisphosphokinase (PRPP-forming) PhnN [Deltaproteobacteria bacterium]